MKTRVSNKAVLRRQAAKMVACFFMVLPTHGLSLVAEVEFQRVVAWHGEVTALLLI
jgi:hypothetical protein